MDFYAIKVGSILVTKEDGRVDREFILNLCRQAAKIIRQGDYVFIVSSGAIACEPDKRMSENLRAVIGQACLIMDYQGFLQPFGIKAGQLLVTDVDLEHPRVIQKVLLEAAKFSVVMIINENDGTSDKEIKRMKTFADNDELVMNISLLPEIKKKLKGVIIGIDKSGVLDAEGTKINMVKEGELEKILTYAKGGNKVGRGSNGARTKFEVSSKLAKSGIPVILAPGRENDFVLRAIDRLKGEGEDDFGTLFEPSGGF